MRKILAIFTVSLVSLSGCQLLPDYAQRTTSVPVGGTKEVCLVQKDLRQAASKYNCDFLYWIDFWVAHDELSWPQRRDLIETLGDSPQELMKKVLLSQAKGTPYQNRLRAQSWADQLQPSLTPEMQNILYVLITEPSQERLEFESALTILTRINTSQSKSLDAQQQQLKEQQQQIDKLLKIEASMMEKREGMNQ